MLIYAEDLCMLYNRHLPDEVTALQSVTLEIAAGEVVSLKGPSGSGKTTLLSLLGCMSRPTSGLVRFADQDVSRLPERFLAQLRRENFGFVFQQFNLIRDISVMENILLPLIPSGLSMAKMKERGYEVLEKLEISHKAKAKVNQISGGEQQRVAIARALISDPKVIIADEPTAHLDSKLSAELIDIFAQLNAEGKTLIIATHDPFVYQHQLIQRTMEMSDGRLIGVNCQ